jgi:hypothetical protein
MILSPQGKQELHEISNNGDVRVVACMMGLLEGFRLEKEIISKMKARENGLKEGVYGVKSVKGINGKRIGIYNEKRILIHNEKGEYGIASSKYEEELGVLRKQIRDYILKAIELGMGEMEIIKGSYGEYFG